MRRHTTCHVAEHRDLRDRWMPTRMAPWTLVLFAVLAVLKLPLAIVAIVGRSLVATGRWLVRAFVMACFGALGLAVLVMLALAMMHVVFYPIFR